MLIVDRAEAASGGVRSAEDVHQDVETARIRDPRGDRRRPFRRGEIGRDEPPGIRVVGREGSRRGPHFDTFARGADEPPRRRFLGCWQSRALAGAAAQRCFSSPSLLRVSYYC